VVDNWYPGDAKKDKGVLLMVTAGKEGAVTGGEGFIAVRNNNSSTPTAAAAQVAAAAAAMAGRCGCEDRHVTC
jgi:hypothetical protein